MIESTQQTQNNIFTKLKQNTIFKKNNNINTSLDNLIIYKKKKAKVYKPRNNKV